ncbi:MAG TPA: hypothetical protein ENJ95_18180 [Bacteroidetes bacterium]|nr:hypothetical protein [Bacteroidota bacterium]
MKKLILFLMLALALACKTKQVLVNECATTGTVKNFAGLDGCQLLIELQNGDLLNPVKLPPKVALKDKQTISFSYKVLPDVMSICMTEKASIEITCLNILEEGITALNGCVDTKNPFEVDWMDKAIDLHNPNQVIKYKDGAKWAYLFRAFPSSYLYTCEGKLICETKNDHDTCQLNYLSQYGRGKIIWQGEGVWD